MIHDPSVYIVDKTSVKIPFKHLTPQTKFPNKGSYTNHVATKGGGGSSKNHNTT